MTDTPTIASNAFTVGEIAAVLSRYDIGIIEKADVFARGSAGAPKLFISSDRGDFLLKRRAAGKDDPNMVAFTHGLQIHLADRQFPLPRLIGTRTDNNSMVQHGGAVYELFEFIRGDPFDFRKESAFQSGRTLALFHKLTRDYKPSFQPPQGGNYHQHQAVDPAFERLQVLNRVLEVTPREERPAAEQARLRLQETYRTAAQKVEALGLSTWPVGLVHVDFHPGNCLYRAEYVVGVIDFDSCRKQQRILDTANAALQFSIRLGAGDPRTWKPHLHAGRLHAFLSGYETLRPLTEAELVAIPWLMIESMTAEVILGLRATGRMGAYGASSWLAMLDAKVNWVLENMELLIKAINHVAPETSA